MGDGVLVYFGYPRAHEDDAERAVRAQQSAKQGVLRRYDRNANSCRRSRIARHASSGSQDCLD
jgi:class 3 adenylate cyclase